MATLSDILLPIVRRYISNSQKFACLPFAWDKLHNKVVRVEKKTQILVKCGILLHLFYVIWQILFLSNVPISMIQKLEGVVILFVFIAMLAFRLDWWADFGPMILINTIIADGGKGHETAKFLQPSQGMCAMLMVSNCLISVRTFH